MFTRRVLAAGLLLPAIAFAWAAETPAEEKERIFKLFVEEFVPLTPGEGKFPASFEMGSKGDDAPVTEKPATKITLRDKFAIARYEVTQELYEAVMGKNPAKWKGPRNSVEMVNWNEANEFCRKVTAELRARKLIGENETIRLPSEAEWEYACRAGTTTRWSFGDDEKKIGDFAWYKVNAPGNDPPVGRKKPNDWGLHEMHGYVWEWCADNWTPTLEGIPTDGSPRPAKEGGQRTIRGGAYNSTPDECRSAFRVGRPVDARIDTLGFRCVRTTSR
jgi:formylglycine-generating enzyme required for sulfatase activity